MEMSSETHRFKIGTINQRFLLLSIIDDSFIFQQDMIDFLWALSKSSRKFLIENLEIIKKKTKFVEN